MKLVLSHSTLKSVMEANSEKIVLQKSIWTIKEWVERRIALCFLNDWTSNKRTRYIKNKVRYIEVFIHNVVDRIMRIW